MHARPAMPHIFQPRSDLPAWDATLPIDWAADPFEDRNWQFQLHSWVNMGYWLYAYQDGDLGALKEMVAIALDWETFHIEENQKSAFQWYDMATGIRASRLAFLLDNIFIGNLEVADSDLAALIRLSELHVAMLLNPWFLSPTNHGLFQIMGLNALCEVISWRTVCEGAKPYTRESLANLLKRWFTDEGVHRENSPNYHGIVLDALHRLRVVERIQQPEIRAIIERGNMVTPWLTYPDGRWVPVGDSAGMGPRLTGLVDPICLGRDADCWAVRDLTKSGYAIIRSLPETVDKSSMLFVSATGEPTGHKHADDLSFVLIERGHDIFVDSGKYGYNKNQERLYIKSARAHNVPSLVGREIDPRQINTRRTYLQPIRMTDAGFIVEGSADRPKLFRHERMFSYSPGRSLTIEDRFYNRTGSRWESNLHLAPDLDPILTSSGFTVMVDNLVVEAEFQGRGCDLEMVRGEVNPFQGWVSLSYLELTPAAVVRASCPSYRVETSWHITFNTASQ